MITAWKTHCALAANSFPTFKANRLTPFLSPKTSCIRPSCIRPYHFSFLIGDLDLYFIEEVHAVREELSQIISNKVFTNLLAFSLIKMEKPSLFYQCSTLLCVLSTSFPLAFLRISLLLFPHPLHQQFSKCDLQTSGPGDSQSCSPPTSPHPPISCQ